MFKQLINQFINQYISTHMAKYEKLPLFNETIDVLDVQIGEYGYGLQRYADIIAHQHTSGKWTLHDARLFFTGENELVIIGDDKKTNLPFQMTFSKESISWYETNHILNTGLDEDYEPCSNPNEGCLDIQLKGGESVILGYILDKTKEFDLVS